MWKTTYCNAFAYSTIHLVHCDIFQQTYTVVAIHSIYIVKDISSAKYAENYLKAVLTFISNNMQKSERRQVLSFCNYVEPHVFWNRFLSFTTENKLFFHKGYSNSSMFKHKHINISKKFLNKDAGIKFLTLIRMACWPT